jgi:hypothetical protein
MPNQAQRHPAVSMYEVLRGLQAMCTVLMTVVHCANDSSALPYIAPLTPSSLFYTLNNSVALQYAF